MEFGLSLGSNLGDRLQHLRAARARVAALPELQVLASAPVYETEPVDVDPAFREYAFLNTVVLVEGAWSPQHLAQELRRIEKDLGRVRGADRNLPRTVDIDLLYADEVQCVTPDLTLPHPRWEQRRFVVQPLADVRPVRILPGQARSVATILAGLPEKPGVAVFAAVW